MDIVSQTYTNESRNGALKTPKRLTYAIGICSKKSDDTCFQSTKRSVMLPKRLAPTASEQQKENKNQKLH
jgi:hypothetical protein